MNFRYRELAASGDTRDAVRSPKWIVYTFTAARRTEKNLYSLLVTFLGFFQLHLSE